MGDAPEKVRDKNRRGGKTRRLLFALIAVLTVLFAVEVILRVAGLDEIHGLSGLDMRRDLGDFVRFLEWDINVEKSSGGSLFIEDSEFLWRFRPGFEGWARDFFLMTVTDQAPRWHFRINKRGFRGPDFEEVAAPGTYRVLCLGDSCIFGFGADEEDTFPVRLGSQLEAICPSCRFEVINMGVSGYSSRQGLELAKRWIPRLAPKVVVVAYGTNDWWRREITDDEAMARARTLTAGLNRFLRKFATVKFIADLAPKKTERERGDILLSHRVAQLQYEKNVETIAEIALKQGAKVMLMDVNFYVPYGTEALRKISERKQDYLYLDAVEILARSLRDVDRFRNEYPVNAEVAEKIYDRVIRSRPIFYLMVDPVHPNGLGNNLLAEKCAAMLIGAGLDRQMVDLMNAAIESLPAARAKETHLFSETALEERLKEVTQDRP